MQVRAGGILGVTCLELATMVTGTDPGKAQGYVVIVLDKDDTFHLVSSACCKETLLATMALAMNDAIVGGHSSDRCEPPA